MIKIKTFYKIFLIIFLALNYTSVYAENYPNTSVGVLDLNKVLLEAKAAKKASEEIDQIAKDIESQVSLSDEEMVMEQNKLIEAQSIMAPEAYEEKLKEYENKVREYNVNRQQKLLSIDLLIEKSRNEILDNLKPILENISEERGITILLEKNSVLLNAEAMDLTELVIKQLNKALPKIEISYEE